MSYHKPVMLNECIQGLNIDPAGVYVDATFGGGGHSQAILSQLTTGSLIAFDQDPDAKKNLIDDKKFLFVNENFRHMKNFLRLYGKLPVSGILADLGVSSWQIDEADRGFSTRFEGPLDMRMNRKGTTAKDIVNLYDTEGLVNIFQQYGELKNASRIAKEIEYHRKSKSINTTGELKSILQKLAPRGRENKFYSQVFQALRIGVNNELEALKELLIQSVDMLKSGGRMVVISYHSLEDRMVKKISKSGNLEGEVLKDFYGNNLSPVRPVGKLMTPSDSELEANPRSRSARLRIIEKI